MQRICPSCGNQVGPDEIFCSHCGERLNPESGVQNSASESSEPQYKSPVSNVNGPQYQAPAPNAGQPQYQAPVANANPPQYQAPAPNVSRPQYQAPAGNMSQPQYQAPNQSQYQTPVANSGQPQYQAPTQNTYQNQYIYAPGQQNMPPYTMQPYQQQMGGRKKSGNKGLIIGVIVGAVVLVTVAAIFIVKAIKDNIHTPPITPGYNDVTPTATPIPTVTEPSDNGQTNTDDSQSKAYFNINVLAKGRYEASEGVFYVDYTATLSNTGTAAAENVKVYFDPDEGDENAQYLYIGGKHAINDTGVDIDAGSQQDISMSYIIDYIEPGDETAQQNTITDLQNRFIAVPITIEWEEDGVAFVSSKIALSPLQ